MAESLAVLAVACNILDIITATGKACSLLREVHKHGALPAHDELSSTAAFLDTNVQTLTESLRDPSDPSKLLQADDKGLTDLASKCQTLARELKSKLAALKVNDVDSRSHRWAKLSKTVLQRGKIYDLHRRWEELQRAVNAGLLVRLK